MAYGWTDFLSGAHAAGHAAQVYDHVDELAASVGVYLATGFAAGQPGVVVATGRHWGRFADELRGLGWEPAEAEERGLLTVADAEEVLETFMDPEGPSAPRFERVVGGLLDRASARKPSRRVRVFGEMVDVLSRRGRPDAAVALEELWNRLARTRDFSLLCGYRLDPFDRAAQVAALPGVCRTHSHVRPAADPDRFARAVDFALEDVLGPDQAGKVYLLIGEQAREARVPVPQLALMWISAHMPVFAERVLAAARAHYRQPVPQPAR